MKLYMPTEVYFEKNAVKNHSAALAGLGKKGMIVTGKHSSRLNGSLTDVEEALQSQGIPSVIFDEVEENPSVATVAEAARLAVAEQADFFIGIGGGSPMDAAKAIALLAKNPDLIENAREALYTSGNYENYPLAEIPTTSGTGSEVTQYAILTLHDKNTKKSMAHHVFARIALVDAKYLKTASYAGMVSTCVDALAHLLESHLNTNATAFSRMYAEEGLRIWGSVRQYLVSEQAFRAMPEEAFETFMRASVIAGISIAHTTTSLPHGLSYPVTYELGVPHGKAVGVFLPGFLETCEDKKEVNRLLKLLGFSDIEAFSEYIRTLLGTTELPDELWERDMRALLENPAKLKNYPYTMDEEKLNRFRPR